MICCILMNKAIFTFSRVFKVTGRFLLIYLISLMHRSMKTPLFRLGSGYFDVLLATLMFRCVSHRYCRWLQSIRIPHTRMCMRSNVGSIEYEFIDQLEPPIYLWTLCFLLQVHCLVLIVIVVYRAPQLNARLAILQEFWANKN